MKEKMIYTKSDFKDLLRKMGIQSGDVVCVQADLSKLDVVISNEQALIEALQETVTQQGCIIVPTFSLSCLDPSCLSNISFPYDTWSEVRENIVGFQGKVTACDVYGKFANQFLMNPDVIRSQHPIYSFAFWGKSESKWMEQSMDYPISFRHILRSFAYNHAKNILIGVPKNESVLLPAIAKTMKLGTSIIERAFYRQSKSTHARNFLNVQLDKEKTTRCLELCYQNEFESKDINIYVLSLEG